MKINQPDPEYQNQKTEYASLVDYMKHFGHIPVFADEEITVFSLFRPDSLHITLTINNRLDRLESFQVDYQAGIFDLASLIFNAEIDQIIASPKTFGFDGFAPPEKYRIDFAHYLKSFS